MNRLRLRLPVAPLARPQPEAFVLYPLAALPGPLPCPLEQMQALYERAYEEARRCASPGITERDLLGVWN